MRNTSVIIENIEEIQQLLLAYANGNYKFPISISTQRDERDSILSGVMMLGEELEKTTISRDFFSTIFNTVADMVFVVSAKGIIETVNKASYLLLRCKEKELINLPIDGLFYSENTPFIREIKKILNKTKEVCSVETDLVTFNKKIIPVECTCAKIMDSKKHFRGYLIFAKDITERQQREQMVLKTIVDTQEAEQKRIADDLHDSLGQELLALRSYLSSLELDNAIQTAKTEFKDAFTNSKTILDKTIKNLRSICFNIMPSMLQHGCIKDALDELIRNLEKQLLVKFNCTFSDNLPPLPKSLDIVIYRISQEFINNSIKHSLANNIEIKVFYEKKRIVLDMKDDGCGFKMTNKRNEGRGLSNIYTRTKAMNGTIQLESNINQGTHLHVSFPIH